MGENEGWLRRGVFIYLLLVTWRVAVSVRNLNVVLACHEPEVGILSIILTCTAFIFHAKLRVLCQLLSCCNLQASRFRSVANGRLFASLRSYLVRESASVCLATM